MAVGWHGQNLRLELMSTWLRHLMVASMAAALRLAMPCYFRVRRYGVIRTGRASFYGPDRFLKLSKAAMLDLQRRDSRVWNSIQTQRYVFWYEPNKLDYFDMHFSVNEEYCAWDQDGLMAFLVYAHYKTSTFKGRIFPLRDRKAAHSANIQVRAATHAWLVDQSFPAPLIECYEDAS